MPKSSVPKRKAKNAGVGIDFKRAKHKVGKKLPKAQNATDTNFKSKAITLSEQSVGQEKGAAVSQRNLTLKELLGQLGHYSPKVRREALQGFYELLTSYPEELQRQTGPVMEKLADRLADAEGPVRSALKRLLAELVLPGLDGGALIPFLPLLMAHVCSAMTHLDPGIRADALVFLELLMAAAPVQISKQYALPAMQHYCSLLAPATRGRSVASRSLATLLEALNGLCKFLNSAAELGATSATAHPASESSPTKVMHEASPLLHHCCDWPPPMAVSQAAKACCAMSMPWQRASPTHSQDSAIKGIHTELLGHLLDAWAECTPSATGEACEIAAVQAMEACLQCLRLLMQHQQQAGSLALSPDEAQKQQTAILKKVGQFALMRMPVVRCPPALQHALVQLNLAGMQLLTSFLDGPWQLAGGQETGWMAPLLDFYAAVLERGEVLPPQVEIASGAEQPPVPAEVYTAILNGVQKVLLVVSGQRCNQLLKGIAALIRRTSPRSKAKLACLRFMAYVFARPGKYLTPNATGQAAVPDAQAADWLQGLPRLLWELQGSRPEASHLALQVLFNAARFAQAGEAVHSACRKLQPSLALFYCTLLPGKGPKSQPGGNREVSKLLSPLSSLPTHSQILAIDLLYYLPDLEEALLKSARLICLSDLFPASTAVGVITALVERLADDGQRAKIANFLASLLGDSQPAMAEGLPGKVRAEVVNAATSWTCKSLEWAAAPM